MSSFILHVLLIQSKSLPPSSTDNGLLTTDNSCQPPQTPKTPVGTSPRSLLIRRPKGYKRGIMNKTALIDQFDAAQIGTHLGASNHESLQQSWRSPIFFRQAGQVDSSDADAIRTV